MAQLLADDNSREVRTVTPANGRKFTLEEMQAMVGGFVEMLGLPNGQILMFNEEGKYKDGFVLNTSATALARGAKIAATDGLVGPVVLATREEAGFNDEEGDDGPDAD